MKARTVRKPRLAKRRRTWGTRHIPKEEICGPPAVEDILKVQGRIEAVQREPRLTEERRRFLIERIPHWNAWLRRDRRGVIVNSDCE